MVIAVLGVLAAVVLVAIDPAQQLARGRDSGRKTSIGQLGRALEAYYTNNGKYPETPLPGPPWNDALLNSGEIKTFPSNPPLPPLGGIAIFCLPLPDGGDVNRFCLRTVNSPTPRMVVFTKLESKSEQKKCPTSDHHYERIFYAYLSSRGQAGIICMMGASDDGWTGSVPHPDTVPNANIVFLP
jgi:type II secretory pathway pseudopilin PulG